MTDTATQLKLAGELTEVLGAIAEKQADIALLTNDLTALDMTRQEILQSLQDSTSAPKKTSKGRKIVDMLPEAKLTPTAVETAQVPEAKSEDPLAGAKAFDETIGTKTQAEKEAEAWKLYDDGLTKRSDASMRRIFAIVGSYGYKSDDEMKQIIWGIVAKLHAGAKLESTKDLSQPWANDINDYLDKHKPEELAEFLSEPFK